MFRIITQLTHNEGVDEDDVEHAVGAEVGPQCLLDEALLLEAENEEQENDDVEALLLQAEQEAAEDEFLLQAYSQNPP